MIVCGIGIIGMIMQCSIPNYWGLMAGRLVNAVSMGKCVQKGNWRPHRADKCKGIEANTVPMYMAELAPASIRGGLVNFYQSWLYVGAIFATATVYGSTSAYDNRWAYLIRM